jgi:sulfonate transport system substrate-binding protein
MLFAAFRQGVIINLKRSLIRRDIMACKKILGMLTIVALFAGGLLITPSLSNAEQELRMGNRSTNLDLILLESGLLKKYNLNVKVIRMKTGVEMAEAMVGRSINIGIIGGTPLTSLLTRTKTVICINNAWTTDGGYAKVLVRKDSPYKTLEDLKGKKIATKIGSGSYRVLGDYCKLHGGIKYSDFKILNTAPASILAALESGSVEAGIWFAPTTSIAVHKGFARILMDFKGANLGQATWTANKAFAEENFEMVSRYLAASMDAQDLLRSEPNYAAKLLSQGLKKRGRDISPEILEIGINDFIYEPGFDRKVEVFETIFKSMKAAGKLRGDMPDFSAFIDKRYYNEAQKIRAVAKK